MREYDVTPAQQGSNCIHQWGCVYYKYGIYCNECRYNEEIDDIYEDIE